MMGRMQTSEGYKRRAKGRSVKCERCMKMATLTEMKCRGKAIGGGQLHREGNCTPMAVLRQPSAHSSSCAP
jgi:hypothetical protein